MLSSLLLELVIQRLLLQVDHYIVEELVPTGN